MVAAGSTAAVEGLAVVATAANSEAKTIYSRGASRPASFVRDI